MKCVKSLHDGVVRRLSDEMAARSVTSGAFSYVPKSEWKALRTAPVVAVVHTDEQVREIARKVDKKKHSQAKRDYRKS